VFAFLLHFIVDEKGNIRFQPAAALSMEQTVTIRFYVKPGR